MKIAILGAGAMGCLIGGKLQAAGADIVFIGRGAHVAAMQARGLTLRSSEGETTHMPVRAFTDTAQAGAQDAILICTKTHQLAGAAVSLAPMLRDDTMVLPVVNGLPWWYFFKEGGEFDGRSLPILDPDGAIAAHIAVPRIVGCVNYLAGRIAEAGVVEYVPEIKKRIVIGELDGTISPRLSAIGSAFEAAGFEPKLSEHIRQVIWHKLWGNIAFNPIGALTHGTIDQIAEGYHDCDLLMAVMHEARFIADKLGIDLGQTMKSRIEAAAKMRGHKTSMQQDIEAGKRTEIDAIVGVVRDIGKWMEADTPYLNTLYSLVRLKELFYK